MVKYLKKSFNNLNMLIVGFPDKHGSRRNEDVRMDIMRRNNDNEEEWGR